MPQLSSMQGSLETGNAMMRQAAVSPIRPRAVERQVLVGFGMSVLVIVAVAFVAWRSTIRFVESAAWVSHTQAVLGALKGVEASVHQAVAAERGHVITGDDRYIVDRDAAISRVLTDVQTLKELTADNAEQQANLAVLETQIGRRRAVLDELMVRRQTDGFDAARAFMSNGEPSVAATQFSAAIAAMENVEKRLLENRTFADRQSSRTMFASFVALALAVAFMLVLLSARIRREMTARERREEEVVGLNADLTQRSTALEAANRDLEAFSYSVAHDLRGPLRAIDGFSKALVEDYGDQLDETARDYLQRVEAAAGRMGELIDDLLALSRITRANMEREIVDLGALARMIADELHRRDPQREIQWDIGTGLAVEGDPKLLRIALENLLGNAWKFTGKKPDALIKVGHLQQDGQTVFYVRDNGAGFDQVYANKLFGMFQRLHKATEFEGTGVGLATADRVISRHGGRIWAEGAVDAGATFYFTLYDRERAA